MAVKGTVFKRVYKRRGKEIWCINVTHDEGRLRKAIGSKQDAKNALEAVLTDIRRREYNFKVSKKIRLEDFAERYPEYSEAHKKPRSYKRDKSSFSHLTPYSKDMILSKITPKQVDDYIKKKT